MWKTLGDATAVNYTSIYGPAALKQKYQKKIQLSSKSSKQGVNKAAVYHLIVVM